MAFALLVSLFAIFSGLTDADKIIKDHDILQSGLNILNEHKTFGFVIVAILFITTLTKWIAISKDSLSLEKLSLLLIILTIASTLYQGNHGGSIVYKYSGGISNKVISQRIDEQNRN